MSTKTTKTAPTAVDMQRLTQSQVSWLLGLPTSWLRNNSQLFLRDDDGRYDARQVIEVTLKHRTQTLQPAEISDEHLGPLDFFVLCAVSDAGRLPGILRVINEIETQHGAAGLAAIGALIKEEIKKQLSERGRLRETEAQIIDKHQQQLDKELARLRNWEAVQDWRVTDVCEKHQSYRWGRAWKSLPLPPGYVAEEVSDPCPKCEKR